MAKSGALTQTAFYALSILLMRGIGFVMLPYVTRHLGPAEYGEIELLNSLADVLTTVLSFGLVNALYRFAGAAQDPAQSRIEAASAFGLILGLALLAAIILQIAAPLLLPVLGGSVPLLALRCLLAAVSLEGAVELPLAWLRLGNRSRLYLAVIGGRSLIQAALVVLALEKGWGVTGIMAAGLITGLLTALVLGGLQYRATGIRFDRDRARALLRYGAPMIIGGIGGFVLGSCDRLILARYVPVSELAIYAIAAKVAMLTPQMFQPFGLWWFPRRIALAQTETGRHQSAGIIGFGMAYLIWLALCMALGGPVLITLLTPPAYHGALTWLPWLLLAGVLQHIGDLTNVGSYLGLRTHRPMLIDLGSAGIALAGYALLIPGYGVGGAVAATVLAYLARLIFYTLDGRRVLSLALPWPRLCVLALVATGLILALPVGLTLSARIAATALAGLLLAGLALGLGLIPLPARLQGWYRPEEKS